MFNEAYEIAHSLESSRQTTEEVKKNPILESTNALDSAQPQFRRARNPTYRQTTEQSRATNKQSSQSRGDQEGRDTYACDGCGAPHKRRQCPHLETVCHKCKKKGHLTRICRSTNGGAHTISQVPKEEIAAENIDSLLLFKKVEEIHTVRTGGKILLEVKIEGHKLEMELDTGSPAL